MTPRLIECPNGHRVKPVPVVYGYPSPELLDDSKAGRVRLGGCDPTFEDERLGDCPICGAPIAESAPERGAHHRLVRGAIGFVTPTTEALRPGS